MKANGPRLLTLVVLLAFVAVVQAQQDNPHIGYVYPAGGQQGATFQVLLGGQHLDGAAVAYISGAGVKAEVIEHVRPLNQGQFKEMQNRMGELNKQKEAAAPSESGRRRRGGGSSKTFTNENWTAEEEKKLADIRQRLATFSIRRSSVPALVETVALNVTVAEDAEPGERELRLQTELGLTNPLVFCIGQLPEIAEESARSVAETESLKRGGRGRKRQQSARPDPGTSPTTTASEVETDITLPTTVNGQILPGDVDRYRFKARKGQQLVVDVSARKLIPFLSDAVPGWFQATVALFDANGKEVAYDDDFRFHPDPVLHCEIPEDGEYVVEIRDALYRGREDFVYRVALGELPFLTGVSPLGTRSGTRTMFELSGWNLPTTKLTLLVQEPGTHSISVRRGKVVSNHVPFAVDSLKDYSEREPNDDADSLQRIKFPLIVNGRIDRPGDVDVFGFACRAGTQIVVEVKARRLGSSLDSVLKLTNAAGEQVAFNDDYEDKAAGLTTHHADSRLSFTIPESGFYHLHVANGQQTGGADYSYRLHIDTAKPDFELRVVPSSINVRAGTTVPITVHALRRDGFSGEIALALKDAPPGFELAGGSVPAGKDVVRATLTVPAESREEPIRLSLLGCALINRRKVIRQAVPADDMMQAFIYRHLVPAEDLKVAVVGTPRTTSTMSVLSTVPVKIPTGGTARVRVNVPGRSFFGAVQLELDDPPDGITIEEVSFARRQDEIVLRSDAAVVEPGLKGNLIVNAVAARTGEDSGKGKEQRKKRRILLSTLPAIPFEIVGE